MAKRKVKAIVEETKETAPKIQEMEAAETTVKAPVKRTRQGRKPKTAKPESKPELEQLPELEPEQSSELKGEAEALEPEEELKPEPEPPTTEAEIKPEPPAIKPETMPVPEPEQRELTLDMSVFKPHERKNRKFMLLMKPSVHEYYQAFAAERGTSVNDVINTILEAFMNGKNG